MERLKAIGFDRLVEINCRQINRSLCAQYMACFEPPTKQVSIRAETRVIGAEHVHQLMGLPCGGKGIEVKVTDQNPVFRDFRRACKNVKYKTLGDTLLGKLDENFEYLFVLFTLGTLLAPSASIYVSDRMLKVMTLTKDALGDFDWSSFILQELTQQIYEFNKDSYKSKGDKRKIVGGCVYFLMPLNTSQPWLIGPMTRLRAEWCSRKKAKKACSLAPLVLSHCSLRRHRLTLTRCSLTWLVSMLGQEMLALEHRLTSDTNKYEGPQEGLHETESPNNQPSSSRESEKDDDKERDEEDEPENIEHIDDDDEHRHDTDTIQDGLDVNPTEEDVVEEVAKPEAQKGERSDEQIRRSKKVITRSSVLKSPWIDPNRKCKGKRPYDEKEQLYELCISHRTKDKVEE
ncbi:hypothetical protein K1719_028394 [Acacia pycnantha]|nr:hypothetical protein K1719_028394 [Acacia pycnantha]